jgi:hypothetical protein
MAPYLILPPPSLPTAEHFCLRRRQLWFYLRLPQAGAGTSIFFVPLSLRMLCHSPHLSRVSAHRSVFCYYLHPYMLTISTLTAPELTMLSPITPSRSFTTSLDNLQTIHQLSTPSRTFKTDIAAFQPPTTSTPRDASSVQSATSINDYWELPAYSCRVRVFRRPAHVRESLPLFFRRISTSPSYRCTTASRGSPASPPPAPPPAVLRHCLMNEVQCAARADTSASKIRSPSPILSPLPDDAPHTKILRLLRVLHRLNAAEPQRPVRPFLACAQARVRNLNKDYMLSCHS